MSSSMILLCKAPTGKGQNAFSYTNPTVQGAKNGADDDEDDAQEEVAVIIASSSACNFPGYHHDDESGFSSDDHGRRHRLLSSGGCRRSPYDDDDDDDEHEHEHEHECDDGCEKKRRLRDKCGVVRIIIVIVGRGGGVCVAAKIGG